MQGRDLILSDDRLAASRAFANKIWNAARFVMMNLDGAPQPLPPVEIVGLGTRRAMDPGRARRGDSRGHAAIDTYEFNVAALSVYSSSGTSSVTGISSWPRSRSRRDGERQAAARYVLVPMFRQDAAAAASVHAIHLGGNLAGASAVLS